MKRKMKLISSILILTLGLVVFSCKNTTSAGKSTTEEQVVKAEYTCPMHDDVVQEEPGNCPKCGMAFVEKESEM